jgi:hypothetical protein
MTGNIRVERYDVTSSQVICSDIDDSKKNIDYEDLSGKTETTNLPTATYKKSLTPFRTDK